MKSLENEAPNVVTELRFRQLLAKGYHAEIVCQEDSYRRASVWYGEWVLRVVSPDRTTEKLLVTSPRRSGHLDEFKVRAFRTINGLASFMRDVGFKHMDVPFSRGGRSLQMLPEEALDKGESTE